jgi:hypothetical protein
LRGNREQRRGTIAFGRFTDDGKLAAYWNRPQGVVGIPRARIGTGQLKAFGAFWGQPIGDDAVRITLYEVRGGTLHRVWSQSKRVDVVATGFADTIVPIAKPATYRMEVTRGNDVMAWGLLVVIPPCESLGCSGG